MKFKEHPKVGDKVRQDFIIKKIVSKTKKYNGKNHTYYYLYVEKDNQKRILSYNPRTKEISGSFERHFSSFGKDKGTYKEW